MTRTTVEQAAEQVRSAVHLAIEAANHEAQMADLAGEEDTSFQYLEDQLKAALSEVQRVRHHAHAWNENDYCDICGADGRA